MSNFYKKLKFHALFSRISLQGSYSYFTFPLGSTFYVNETSQSSERYSAQMQATMKQKRSYVPIDERIPKTLLVRSIWPLVTGVLQSSHSYIVLAPTANYKARQMEAINAMQPGTNFIIF